MEVLTFTDEERAHIAGTYRKLMRRLGDNVTPADIGRLRHDIAEAVRGGFLHRDSFGVNPVWRSLDTALALCEQIAPDRNMTIAMLLFNPCRHGFRDRESLEAEWGEDVARLVGGLIKVSELYAKAPSVQSENFRNLLLTFAEDIRVIILMIVDRFVLMKAINHHPDQRHVSEVALEANYLYAPLAHRLGLYAIKRELEDMSLKYNNRDIYTRIARKLNETKTSRDAYIADFIAPVKKKLEEAGLRFEIKGRTKSIYSIWNKMKKQKNDLDGIYDLFAIRIVLDSEGVKEKSDCWLAYSLITDMFTPNPSRMKDWISIPKSNGYESLHITVKGPANRWVEVQIRTRRMDLIAEKGLAAHWKYKGIKSEGGLDQWMNNVRDILETADSGPLQLMRNMRMDVYDKEVFVFTPRGDLYNLPLGATLLDFAFMIHTNLGAHCTGGRVNGKNQKINYRLVSGDTVEIMSSPSQQPKQDWLNFVTTSKARNKIRVTLKEIESRAGDLGKEMLQRRCKNRKVELDDAAISKVAKKLGYKNITDFYTDIAGEKLEVNDVIETWLDMERKATEGTRNVSADTYVMQPPTADADGNATDSDVVVIGEGIKGINYRLARCCNPIYGDDVFGFISAEGVIKIHRADCPNAANIRRRYPYRVINTRWSGKIGAQFGATLRIVGRDDIGIVTNITSIINKEKSTSLRNISIESHDGLFQGYVVVGIENQESLNQLIRKLKTVKGVKDVQRT
ncbi:MAG: bifunctional (p)ppGpp synthetase/guanosine-3',5'-bis(diphosphate) 3'-pyrophosphohydrolase [Muribaculaceae bacterium]|nr:bifunctional (p)ppGpp synthetase/guanosine-3',5'-bis(diphosphate) 3'-pyrophosphohydrolase [Muribaculaceae bacterium]